MDDYIKRSDAIEALHKAHSPYPRRRFISVEAIKNVPAADVRPVVRGKWENAIQSCGDSPHIKCSVCGTYFWQYFRQFNWCPICGAKMGGADG